jgi:hypothetical protein
MATYNPPFSVGQTVGQAATNQALSMAKNANKPKRPKQNFLPPSPDDLSQDARDTMAIQNNMMMPSRGFKRAGGDKPDLLGGGMDEFYTKNPQIARGPERANQIAAERQGQLNRGVEAGRAAVQEKLAEQQMQAQTIQDNAGKNRSINRGYGVGSVEFLPTGQKARGTMTDPLTGKQVYMDEYLPQQSRVQDTKYGAMPGQEDGGALARLKAQQPATPKPSGSSQNFLPQISPSGGGMPSLVGAGGSQGAPGGDFMPMPSWVTEQTQGGNFNQQMNDFYKTQYSNPFEGQPMPAPEPTLSNAGPQPQGIANWQPDWMNTTPVPDQSPEQLEALRRLRLLFGDQSPASAGLEASWTNILPGQNDWETLQQLFPQDVLPGAGASQNMRRLQTKYRNPANRFPVREQMY